MRPYPHLIAALDQYYGRSPTRRSLRILITTFWKFPQPGGLSTYIAILKRGLEQRGHRVDVADGAQIEAEEGAHAEIVQFLRRRYGEAPPHLARICAKLGRYERKLRQRDLAGYDVVHAQDRFSANVLGQIRPDVLGPICYTPHQLGVNRSLALHEIAEGSLEAAFFRAIDRAAIGAATRIITLCNVFHAPLMGLGAMARQLHTVYTGTDLEVARTSGRAKTSLVIASISRITARKGHRDLLMALSRIRPHLGGVQVWIVGDGPERGAMEQLARDLDLAEVQFLGHRTDVAEILADCDIFVHPTTSDMLPLSVIEAMIAGQAIITTPVNGLAEIIRDEETGCMVQPGNVEQLAAKLVRLIHDGPKRRELGTKARQFADTHLRAEGMVDQIEAIYEGLLLDSEP